MQATTTKWRYGAVIFDLDGTLANTFPTVVRIFNRLMENRTGRVWTLEELIPYFGPPETIMFRSLFPEATDYEAIAREFYRLSREDGEGIRPFPGIERRIRQWREAGIKLGVYSGASTLAARIRVEHAGLLDLFDAVLGGDEVAHYKPHPEGIFKLLDLFQIAPPATLYVGDMVADIKAGREAGVTTVAVTWGAGKREELLTAGPDYLIDEPAMLGQILLS